MRKKNKTVSDSFPKLKNLLESMEKREVGWKTKVQNPPNRGKPLAYYSLDGTDSIDHCWHYCRLFCFSLAPDAILNF